MARTVGANGLDSNNKNNIWKKSKDKINGGKNIFYFFFLLHFMNI